MRARTVEILEKARDKIEGGWCQHHGMLEREGVLHYCMAGSIESSVYRPAAQSLSAIERGAALEAYEVIQSVIGSTPLICWNDAWGRRKEEVLAVMNKAIYKAKAELAGEQRGKMFDSRMPTHVPIVTVLTEWEEVMPRELVNA